MLTKLDFQNDIENARYYIWDEYKYLWGIRPRFLNLFGPDSMSDEEVVETAYSLAVEVEEEEQRIKREKQKHFDAFNKYAPDTETAKRWMRQCDNER